MDRILIDENQIRGHIYIITNTHTNKSYVGQTLSHRKNHGKYRLFGYEGRFRDHISEAVCNTKKNQSVYLNNAVRLYGADAFKVRLIEECDRNLLDEKEQYYIKEYNTLFPHGYNLTIGGKGQFYKGSIERPELNTPKKRGGCTGRSEETRRKMSEELKKTFNDDGVKEYLMRRGQEQHKDSKFKKLKGVTVDINNIDQYIHKRHSKKSGDFIKVTVEGKSVSFSGKHETFDAIYNRARQFLQDIYYAT